jgi:hypothetical protein
MPAEIDDEFVTEWNILSQPPDQPSITVGCNVYTRLMGIISKITKYIYPLKAPLVDGKGLIRLDLVKEIEQDLERWRSSIPEHLIQPAVGSRFFKYHPNRFLMVDKRDGYECRIIRFNCYFIDHLFIMLRQCQYEPDAAQMANYPRVERRDLLPIVRNITTMPQNVSTQRERRYELPIICIKALVYGVHIG